MNKVTKLVTNIFRKEQQVPAALLTAPIPMATEAIKLLDKENQTFRNMISLCITQKQGKLQNIMWENAQVGVSERVQIQFEDGTVLQLARFVSRNRNETVVSIKTL